MINYLTALFSIVFFGVFAQDIHNNPTSNHGNKFEQLGSILPTPNVYRTASGAPGHKYWQQKADYDIHCFLDAEKQILKGKENIIYTNNSPDSLTYLWFQLDENSNSSSKKANFPSSSTIPKAMSASQINYSSLPIKENDLGVTILKVSDANANAIPFVVNQTMMRIDLPKTLQPGEKISLTIDWNYKISNRLETGSRGGYEYFSEENNYIFTITQWYPRLCVYSDFQGWQNHQFTGRGEFALSFGDFKVKMNVPADYVVGSTGECLNYNQVLNPTQLSRWKQAQSAKEPIEIITLDEAKTNEKSNSKERKTWEYEAKNVRDFAWTASKKYVWDAMPQLIKENNNKVMCMSFYGKEAYGLYRPFSTKAIAHTIKTYSDFTIPYPYPVAQSIEAANGMEYPMICFNYGRTQADGTYSESLKYGMIGVVIHEVGHNFFPMIINSDERQWSWMDEGLNTFVEYLTEELWDNKFPSKRGAAHSIVSYMKLPKDQLEPIMTNSENIIQFGPNAYSKPATALNILRETIMGRKLFDYAFKTYSKRWAFKHPTPADLFRTMEDASGVDLDWYWRGWFYGTDAVDIALDEVKYFRPNFSLPKSEVKERQSKVDEPLSNGAWDDISKIRNREDKNIRFLTDTDPSLQDFYWKYARGLVKVDQKEVSIKSELPEEATPEERKYLENLHAYQLSFSNKGGLVMPIILEFTFADGSKKTDKVDAQIWRKNENQVSLSYFFDKKLKSILLDPLKETADIDESNNRWGGETPESPLQIFKAKKNIARGVSDGLKNPMQAAQK